MSSSPLCTRCAAWWAASVMSVEVLLLMNDMVHHRTPAPARFGRAKDGRCCSRWLRKVWSCNSLDENKQMNKQLSLRLLCQLDVACDRVGVDGSYTPWRLRWCVHWKEVCCPVLLQGPKVSNGTATPQIVNPSDWSCKIPLVNWHWVVYCALWSGFDSCIPVWAFGFNYASYALANQTIHTLVGKLYQKFFRGNKSIGYRHIGN